MNNNFNFPGMKKYVSIVFLSVFVFSLAWSQDVNQKWLDALNQGKKLYKAGSFDAALKSFLYASEIVPFDTSAFVYIADCGLKTGKPEEVGKAVNKLILLQYKGPFLYEVSAASLRTLENKYQEAFTKLQEGLQLFPNHKGLLYEEILTYYETGNYSQALLKADAYIKKFPLHLEASKLLLNIVTLKLNDIEKAPAYFSQIRANFPNDEDLLKQELDFYLRTGNLDKAQSQIEQMLTVSPKDAKLHYNLGLIYYHKGEYEKSIEACNAAVQIDPNFTDAHFNIGIFNFLMGVEYNKALSEMNPYQFTKQGKEGIEMALAFFETARPHLQQVARMKPEELDAFEALSTMEVLEKNLRSLLPQLEAAARIGSDTLQAQCAPALLVNKLRFEYANKIFGTLRKGEKGFICFELQNSGTCDAYNVNILITEPVALPYVNYPAKFLVDTLRAGQTRLMEIPVEYVENNPNLRGIKKISDIQNKLRLLVTEPNGNNSEILELTFKLDSDPNSLLTDDDFWETATIDFAPVPVPVNYLLIIGINDYLFWPKLSNAVKDSKDLKQVLISKFQFSEKNIYELYDTNATYENIRNELVKIKNNITPNDNLVIYYAGHGNYDEETDNGFWIPVNSHQDAPLEFIQTSIIYNYLSKIEAKHIFLIADACFSGSLFKSNAISYRENDDKSPSRWAFSSGNIEVVADGQVGENSPFAQSLMEVLSSTRKNISVSQLIQNVKFRVETITEQTPIGRPMNMDEHQGGEFIFYLKKRY